MKDSLIAVDIGTTSAKALLYRVRNGAQFVHTVTYNTYFVQPGYAEQDAEEVLEGVVAAVRGVMERSESPPDSVRGICFGGVWQSMLPVDQRNAPLSRALLWSDNRSQKQSEALAARLDTEAIKARTGCLLHPMYFPAKILWLKEQEPERFQKTARFVSIKEYVLHKLFGVWAVDKSIASGTGLLSMADMDWDRELLEVIGIGKNQLSPLVEPTDQLGCVLPDYAARMGLGPAVQGVAGAADGALSHLGSVGFEPGKMSLTAGTGAALRKLMPAPKTVPGHTSWCYYLAKGYWLMGGVVMDAGNALRWVAENFFDGEGEGADIYRKLNDYAVKVPVGADGVSFLPYLGGDRCPVYCPQARGVISGLTFAHSKHHIARALMEGTAHRLYEVYRALDPDNVCELVASGGLFKGEAFLEITADYIGKPLHRPAVRETSAWGCILLGMLGLGLVEDEAQLAALVRLDGRQEPDPRNHSRYRVVRNRYSRLYTRLFLEWDQWNEPEEAAE